MPAPAHSPQPAGPWQAHEGSSVPPRSSKGRGGLGAERQTLSRTHLPPMASGEAAHCPLHLSTWKPHGPLQPWPWP